MKRSALVGLLLAVLAPLWAGTAQQASAATSSCDGVWVVVDYGSLGGIETKCATSYGTGAAALRSAGFDPTIDDGFVYKISGKPSKPDISKAYWSYWQATLTSDGSYSGWSYSNLGATASHPQRGNAEGWRYQSLSDGKVPPGAAPPKGEASSPTPKPTQSDKPSAKPTKTPTKSPSSSASATKSSTPSATASATRTESPSPSPSATSGPPTPTPEGTTPSATAAPSTAAATPYASEVTGSSDEGGPGWFIAAGIVVVAAGGGLGLWWYLKGRRT